MITSAFTNWALAKTLYAINNGFVQNFQVFCFTHEAHFEEILGLSIKRFVINRKNGLEGVEKNEG